jgi:multisubunit Na+/H+ antiporter MnhB subunit
VIWLDGLLAAVVLACGWASLASRDLFRSVVMFIVLGAFLAFAWARLGAPDVALAEVALGAGLTGALLLRAVGTGEKGRPRAPDAMRGPRLLAFVATLGLGAVTLWALASLPSAAPDLREVVDAELARSGASNPVTAVLLNFRAWDTLLEITVLVVALAGTWALGTAKGPRPEDAADPVLRAFARVLVPVSCFVAGYLLWKGTHAPGGAFQAGAVLAGAGVVAVLAGLAAPRRWPGTLVRVALSLGSGVFASVGASAWVARGSLLSFAPDQASTWIVLIEAAATVSIATALLGLFLAVGGDPLGAEDGSP